jgi:hypothetical protein
MVHHVSKKRVYQHTISHKDVEKYTTLSRELRKSALRYINLVEECNMLRERVTILERVIELKDKMMS